MSQRVVKNYPSPRLMETIGATNQKPAEAIGELVANSFDARINTESPAWAIDRLSILALKIYHMAEQVERKDADLAHKERCRAKLAILQEQQCDLSTAIDQLLEDIAAGRKYMKTYRQMKMYTDPSTNPVLYKK